MRAARLARSAVAGVRRVWSRQRAAVLAAAALLLAGAAWGAARLAGGAPDVPTAEARRGEFVDQVQVRGEIKAQRSMVLTAPARSGDVQILRIVRSGTTVKKGDPVVEFDASAQRRRLEEEQSELRQAEAEIERARAQARITDEQNQTELTKAGYDVERARLETSKQEILSEIDGQKTKLSLADAEQRLKEAEQKVASDRAAAAATVASLEQKRQKALVDVRRYEREMAGLVLRAPGDGMITLLPNFRARGFMGGGAVPEFKAGDRAWPGAAVAELPDLSSVLLTARIEETDRGRIRDGQRVAVRVDAVPDREFPGRVTSISALAKVDFSGWPPAKNFDLLVALEESDPRLRPGMSATGRIAVERFPDVLLIPAEAVFQQQGRPVVYVLRGRRFEPQSIETARRGNGQVVVAKGLSAGDRVALKDPFAEEGRQAP